MNDLLDQIEASLASRQYYLSLIAALTIPDIAGALNASDGLATGERYGEWFETWVQPEFVETVQASLPAHAKDVSINIGHPLSGQDCYRFRCSLLHQGTTQHPKSTFSRIVFVEPGTGAPVMHYNVMNDALNIDLRLFCSETLRGARKWLAAVAGTEPFESNVKKFVSRYPAGLQPYIVGIPVIT